MARRRGSGGVLKMCKFALMQQRSQHGHGKWPLYGGLPMKNGDLPMKICDLPSKIGDDNSKLLVYQRVI